jgi:hypothetical protein
VKISKWLAAGSAVVALGGAGFLAVPNASASTPTITAGPGSHVHCTFSAVAKLSPGLLNDWTQSDHSNDTSAPNATQKAAIASIPNTTYAANSGAPTVVQTATKGATISCSASTVVDATNTSLTDTITGGSIASTASSAGTDEATCAGLLNQTGSTQFTTIIKWTGTTAKINPTTVTTTLQALADIGTDGVGFELSADTRSSDSSAQKFGSIAGSFAGGVTDTKAYIDGVTLTSILAGPATLTTDPSDSNVGPIPPGLCQPSIQVKAGSNAPGVSDSVAIKVKKNKGLKSITLADNSGQGAVFAPTPANSNLDLCVGPQTSCPRPTAPAPPAS